MTNFELRGIEAQIRAESTAQAVKGFEVSCSICCRKGLHITCDRCAIAATHEQVVAALRDAEKEIHSKEVKRLIDAQKYWALGCFEDC